MSMTKKEMNHNYHLKHKDEIHKRQKEYRLNNAFIRERYIALNKDKLKKYRQEYNKLKIKCEVCETMTAKCNLKRHQRSKKCLACVIPKSI